MKMIAGRVGGICLLILGSCCGYSTRGEACSEYGNGTAYGICAHIARDEFPDIERTLRMMSAAGVQSVRTDFDWCACDAGEGRFDFTRFDAVVEQTERYGIRLAVILGQPPERLGGKRYDDTILDAWAGYVGAVVSRYKGHIRDYEIINEANLVSGVADPVAYARFLKRAARAVRQADPQARVLATGVAGVPLDWIGRLYDAGAKDDFDVLAVHPYTHPSPPESIVETTERLRKLMSAHGDGAKPICFNEIGWPTHRIGIGTHTSAFLDLAIRTYFKKDQPIRAAYADMATEDAVPDVSVAEEILRQLPTGSSARSLSPAKLSAALLAGEIDIVVVLGEDYSPRVVDPLADFMAKGGVVVHGNAMPFCYARERTASGAMVSYDVDTESDRRKLRLKETAPWIDMSYETAKFGAMTEDAKRLGFKGDFGRYAARLFVEDTYLKLGDRFVGIVGGTMATGKRFAQGAIYKFNSDWKGAFVVSALDEGCMTLAGDPEFFQGVCLARGMGLSTAIGVESLYPYEFRSPEVSVYYSEHNFGLVHANFSPKPAWSAYTTFVDVRPAGSENLVRKWRDEQGLVYFPCWRRPDGKTAGMIWKSDRNEMKTLSFATESAISFSDHLGAKLNPLEVSKGQFRLEIGPRPIYFIGGELNL